MKTIYIILGSMFLVMTISILWGYQPDRMAMFFAYLTATSLFFGKGFEGDAK